MIIWIIGLSGAGKTTLGQKLYAHMKPAHSNLLFVDGDMVREVWGDSLGHDIDHRRMNHRRMSHLCRLCDDQGIHVIAAALSIFPELREWNRNTFSRYFEVFLDVPMNILRQRDTKDLYGRFARGELTNVVGGDIPFPRPTDPDLVIGPRDSLEPPGRILGQILRALPELDAQA